RDRGRVGNRASPSLRGLHHPPERRSWVGSASSQVETYAPPSPSRGFVEVRRRGSHIVMQRRAANTTTTVPVPDHGEIRAGTLLSIIRQSGLPRSLFESP